MQTLFLHMLRWRVLFILISQYAMSITIIGVARSVRLPSLLLTLLLTNL
jgi:hypothetical protein